MTFLLVHGGGHSSRCWEPTLPYLTAPAIAVDLPGRGRRPGALDQVRIADFVDAVVDDLTASEQDNVVLVGHSMAGLSIPGVLARAHERIGHVVFVSCAIPPSGGSLLDVLSATTAQTARENSAPAGAQRSPEEVRAYQCYDMNEQQSQFTVEIVVPEAVRPLREPVDLAGLQYPVERTWVKLMGDRTFPPAMQDVMAARAGCERIIEIDSGHTVMISHPTELAAALNRADAASRA